MGACRGGVNEAAPPRPAFMSSNFETDFASAAAIFAEVFGVTVDISRGGNTTTGVTAEPYQSAYHVVDEQGFSERVSSRDYVIAVSDYTIHGTATEPRRGDRITETVAGTSHIYEVMPLGGDQEAEWTGTDGGRWLIHTKRVS